MAALSVDYYSTSGAKVKKKVDTLHSMAENITQRSPATKRSEREK